MNAEEPLRVDRLTVRYGSRTALRDVSLSVGPGEFLALAGPNGSGKTTLLRAALGLTRPDAGTVLIAGHPVEELRVRERARRVAWVPQDEVPQENVPVGEYVLYGRYAHLGPFRGETAADRARAGRALSEVGLGDRARTGVLELSGGERQRVLLARAMTQETPLLLLDEPTAHLDMSYQLDLLERVRALCHETGRCAVAALHDLNLAARYADRIAVLSRGNLVANGPPGEVLSESLLREVWGVVAELRRDPRSGLPFLIPSLPLRRVSSNPPGSPGRGPIHVVGGGGTATATLRRLTERGYRVTAGALHLLDSDSATAEDLGVPVAAEVPFAPLSEEVRSRNRELLRSAWVIVAAPFPVGPSNLANLEDLRPFVSSIPTLLIRARPGVELDFADGRATILRNELVRAGARTVADEGELIPVLESLAARSAASTATTAPVASSAAS